MFYEVYTISWQILQVFLLTYWRKFYDLKILLTNSIDFKSFCANGFSYSMVDNENMVERNLWSFWKTSVTKLEYLVISRSGSVYNADFESRDRIH